jgi:hypothetical protein
MIKEIEGQFKSYKDGGKSFIKYLSKKVLNSPDDEKRELISFFLDEIKLDRNGFYSIALQTINEMRTVELAPRIEKIYNEVAPYKDEQWKYSIIELLMKLRYDSPKGLYSEFVTSFLKSHPEKSYFILIQYCNVDPERAVPLLSDYYANYFLNKDMQDFMDSRIGFLFSYFIENPIDYFPDLIRRTFVRNKAAGLHLKELLIEYLNGDMAKQYPQALIEDKLKELKNLRI